ncbi:MAG: hypothetical protein HFH84_02515 [Lachnospiraceae bacterium]|nr:hypothetical protein [Lachnospiraceae bacterium]
MNKPDGMKSKWFMYRWLDTPEHGLAVRRKWCYTREGTISERSALI